MKTEWRLFAGAGGFFALTGAIYWFVSYEHAGSTMLGLAVAAVLMVAGWLWFQSRRLDGPRPEDRVDAEPSDGAADVGYFPGSSIWPFVVGWAGVAIANAFVFGPWLGLAGGLLLVVGVIGYAVESSRKG